MSEPAATETTDLVGSTARIATWNVWGNFGPWRDRYATIEAVLRDANPDVICLQEAWRDDGYDAAEVLAAGLGYDQAATIEWFEPLRLASGTAILSRWKIAKHEDLRLPPEDRGSGAVFQFAEFAGPRGVIQVFNAMLDWRPDLSHVRQRQVERLCAWIRERRVRGASIVLCGDFNAPPDSDEIRMLTGKSRTPAPGLVFYDSWDAIRPDERGFTWSSTNAYAKASPRSDCRIDYIFSAWGGPAGRGQPTACGLLGADADRIGSDHFGVWADLRY